MIFRAAVLFISVLCLVPVAGATVITANPAGCNGGGGGSCDGGPYLLTFGGDESSMTFDYRIPNSQVKLISYLNDLLAGVEVWDYPNKNNTSLKSFDIYLVVGGEDYSTATYSLLLGTISSTLQGYNSGNRDDITETLSSSSGLSAFLAALKLSKGHFGIEVVDTEGSFNLGERQLGSDGVTLVRFAQVDAPTPEPASLGMAGIGLIALCWTLRKKIAR
ncbi:MAG: PEP-CTERM sorting domain-containing protein [Bryobacteraceae bacterium]|jgi:hypothetical protein